MTATFTPVGSCTTIKERKPEYVDLPSGTKGYLSEKVLYALKTPTKVIRVLPNGEKVESWLKQTVVTATIRTDEKIADYRWRYKAEVSFDMSPLIENEKTGVPIPFLTNNKDLIAKDGTNRRQSLNPFPPGFRRRYLRRPDVIIVRDPSSRWPGRGDVDHDGKPHADNLLRLVEIKFPGDDWSKGQEDDYKAIAGGSNRMSVLDVSDCDGDLEKAKRRSDVLKPTNVPVVVPPLSGPDDKKGWGGVPVRSPVRSQEPITEKSWYEPWLNDAQHTKTEIARAVASLWDSAKKGAADLSDSAHAWVKQHAPWLVSAGQWMRDAPRNTWVWVNKQGQILYEYTADQLRAMWRSVQEATDLTWEMLKTIDWGQVVTYVAYTMAGIAAVALMVGAVYVVCVLAAPVFAALAALVAIIGASGAAALAALAAVLGVQQLAAT